MTQYLKPLLFTMVCAAVFTLPVYAGEEKTSHGAAAGKKAMHHAPGKKAMHHAPGKKHSHNFAPHWAQTLSDEQKYDVDQLHLELERNMVVLKASEALKEKELNVLTASGTAKQGEIYTSIDELMAIKQQIMRHRHDHLVEMRGLLTPEQRLSYDMGILKRSGVK